MRQILMKSIFFKKHDFEEKQSFKNDDFEEKIIFKKHDFQKKWHSKNHVLVQFIP